MLVMKLRGTFVLLALAGLLATSPDARALGLGAGGFRVWADDCQTNLGSWTKIEGLDVAGQNVELTRKAGDESLLVRSWLTDPHATLRPSEVTVTLVSVLGEPIVSWRLVDVLPLWWEISVSSEVALEKLELGHQRRTQVPGRPSIASLVRAAIPCA